MAEVTKITENGTLKIESQVEFETKYEVEESIRHPFKLLVEQMGYRKFIYAEGPDVFFYSVSNKEMFGRYRKAATGPEAWWTVKNPLSDKNNIQRTEPNWRVDGTPWDAIRIGAELMGFFYDTKIWKSCDIYDCKDATLVFYTVRDENGKTNHFLEIEVNEELKLTEQQAWDIIEKYEKVLAPLGIKAQKRKKLSLRQMYSKFYNGKLNETKELQSQEG